MTRPAGANATILAAFALAREIRGARLAAGLTPKDLEGRTGVARAKLYALELGDHSRPDSPKRPARLAREEMLALTIALGFDLSGASALMRLGVLAGALDPGSDAPITEREWTRAGGTSFTTLARTDVVAVADAITSEHSADFAPQSSASTTPISWQLPGRRCRVFHGRNAEIAELRQVCRGTLPEIVVVSGAPGVGKSELVREALDDPELRLLFHGLVWISARQREFVGTGSNTETTTSGRILRELASALRTDADRLVQKLRSERWVLVIDNAESTKDEDLLLSRLARIRGLGPVIVTTRSSFSAPFLRAVPHRGLAGLEAGEIEAFLRSDMPSAAAVSLDRVKGSTGGAPLALHWLAGRVGAMSFEAALRDLEAGRAADLYQFMFAKAWREVGAAAHEVLDFLAFQTVEPVPTALLETCGVADGGVGEAVGRLTKTRLAQTAPDGAVTLHPLTAGFVRAQLGAGSAWRTRDAWPETLSYLARAVPDDKRGSDAVLPLGGLANYVDWLGDAVGSGAAKEAIASWTKLSRYLWDQFEWRLYGRCTEIGRSAVELLAGTHRRAAVMLRALAMLDAAWLAMENGRLDEAEDLDKTAIQLFRRLDDDAGLSIAHRYAGVILMARADAGVLTKASRHFGLALESIRRGRRAYPRPGSGAALAAHELAGLDLWQVISGGYAAYHGDWSPGEALALNLLGQVNAKLGMRDEAARALKSSLRIYARTPSRWKGSEAGPMLGLAQLEMDGGRLGRARQRATAALEIARATERKDMVAASLMLLARTDARSRHANRARASAQEAHRIFADLGQKLDQLEAERFLRGLEPATARAGR